MPENSASKPYSHRCCRPEPPRFRTPRAYLKALGPRATRTAVLGAGHLAKLEPRQSREIGFYVAIRALSENFPDIARAGRTETYTHRARFPCPVSLASLAPDGAGWRLAGDGWTDGRRREDSATHAAGRTVRWRTNANPAPPSAIPLREFTPPAVSRAHAFCRTLTEVLTEAESCTA
jgi:hypothetical protein